MKAILSAITGFLVVLLALWGVSHWLIQPAFDQLEDAQAMEDSIRARAAIEGELRQLGNALGNWAEWDDAYGFAENHNPAFIQSNLGDWRVLEKSSHLNLCVILARDGQVLYSGGYDSDLGGDLSLAAFSGERPAILAMLRPVLEREQSLEGILPTERGLLLLAARPILTTRGSGPARGALVFGRFLDAPLLRALSEQTRVAFKLFAQDDPRLTPAERNYPPALAAGVAALRSGPGDTPFMYETLTDLNGQPVALIRTPIRQAISATARSASHALVGVLGLTTLTLLLGGAYLFNRPGIGETRFDDIAAWTTATLTALIGLALTSGLFLDLRQRNQEGLERRFQLIAAQRADLVIEKFRDNLRDLDAVKRFFDGSDQVTRQEFHQFVTPILDYYRGFQAIEWLPRVAREQRGEFEAAARRDGLVNFQFTELDGGGAIVPAAERDEYFPVYYLEPYAGNEKALGYTPAPPHPARGAVLTRAWDSGRLTLGERYTLVQEPAQYFSVLAFAPVYAGITTRDVEERRRRLKGFVLGVIRVGAVVETALRNTAPQGLILRLIDLSAEGERQSLYEWIPRLSSSRPVAETSLRYHQDFPLADRMWRIEIQPNAAFVADHTERTHRWVPAIGGLLTALATLYLFTVISQKRQAEARVALRTAELRASQEYTRAVLDALNDAVFVQDAETGRIVDVNRRMSELYGHTHAEALTLDIDQLSLGTRPYAREDALGWLRKTREEGPQTLEWIAKTRAGALFWAEVSIRFAIIGGRERFIVSVRDIAERKAAERALRESEERFRVLHEASFGGIGIHDQGVILECNQGLANLTGFPVEELVGMNGLLLIAPPWRDLVTRNIRDGHAKAYEVEGLRRDGTVFPLEIQGKSIPYHGRTVRVAEFRDITERRRAEERQRLAAAVFEAAREAIVVTDLDGNIVAINPAFIAMTGYAEAEVRNRSLRLLQSDRQSETYYRAIRQTLARDGVWQGEFWSRRKDGGLFLALATFGEVRDAASRVSYHVIVATDITRQKETEQRIEHLAYYDALTDLPNRALLTQRAELALALAGRRREEVAVLFLDLDRFKEVNDSLGHAEGDTLLVQAAARLRELTRETDTICRLGGDEFVLLLPDTGQPGAARLASKLVAAFGQPFVVAGHSLRVTVSAGIALYPHDGATFSELLKNADTALYRAKHEGRNTWVFYAREMNVATFERLVLESQLRKAIDTGQLRAYFQPKVRLSDGGLAGAEALVRWLHPDHGLIPPGRFIPVAEASDLIVDLGDWMLAEVCRQLAVWRGAGLPPLTVAVNLAARHFRDPGFIDRVERLLAAHGLPAQALELELTESSLLETGARTAETFLALRRLGLGLAIDDFGAGYSNLGYLKRLPLTALKIDQSFVRDLVTDPDDRILAATIVALGHGLGLKVVAEGVETEEQRRILRDQGCDWAQGYLFAPPMPAESFADWLARAA
ncbi:MAG: EAL domain-containing protein [Candidatus Contendobacter sp.]|nr:EAL domain-containing protein [Candidatus Contendobacter sp.]MDG4558003.1 EAL domain-containing protein [Candidatus Contendobacter sp.]